LVTSQMRDFRREDFARFHPAGALGQRLSKVEQLMRPLGVCRVAPDDWSVREVFVRVSMPGRRTGAIMLVDAAGKLSGIFTDSDLARLFERRQEGHLDAPIREVMCASPVTTRVGSLAAEAVETMARRKISELPVVDAEGSPAGMIDITDVVGILPKEGEQTADRPKYGVLREPKRGEAA
jgi:arabinose-5-phosphate isomerase